jgi:hypothetical protein
MSNEAMTPSHRFHGGASGYPGQPLNSLWNTDNWMIGTDQFAAGMAANRSHYNTTINVFNPSYVNLGITQFSFTELQYQWNLTVVSLEDNIRTLAREMEELKEEIRQLCRMRTFVVPLTTLPPGPLRITEHIPVTIEGNGEEFTATFTEANISASGETEADAIANFKESLISSFELLEKKNPAELGPLPTRQWGILTSVIKRAE